MSNSTQVVFYNTIAQQITIYGGLFVLIGGVCGGLLNILVFTTLRIFRETPCVFYLTSASVVDVGQLLTSLLIRILAVGFQIDPTTTSWFCKIRVFLVQLCALVSLTAMTLATVDQFISMTHRRLSSLQLAHRHIFITCLVYIFHGIFFVMYYDTPFGVCTITNSRFAAYFSYFYFAILLGFAPTITMTTFALLAYINIRTIASRQVHVERLGRDRQLTAMVLVQVACFVMFTLPYIISNIITLNLKTTDSSLLNRYYLVNAITILFYYGSYASPFYVFYCVSKRFRKQVTYVLIDIHLRRFQQMETNLHNNQVVPEAVTHGVANSFAQRK